MTQYYFSMGLSAHQLKNYYAGHVKNVIVTTDEGLRLQLPIEVLRPYVTQEGIYGMFVVTVDANNKFVNIQRKE